MGFANSARSAGTTPSPCARNALDALFRRRNALSSSWAISGATTPAAASCTVSIRFNTSTASASASAGALLRRERIVGRQVGPRPVGVREGRPSPPAVPDQHGAVVARRREQPAGRRPRYPLSRGRPRPVRRRRVGRRDGLHIEQYRPTGRGPDARRPLVRGPADGRCTEHGDVPGPQRAPGQPLRHADADFAVIRAGVVLPEQGGDEGAVGVPRRVLQRRPAVGRVARRAGLQGYAQADQLRAGHQGIPFVRTDLAGEIFLQATAVREAVALPGEPACRRLGSRRATSSWCPLPGRRGAPPPTRPRRRCPRQPGVPPPGRRATGECRRRRPTDERSGRVLGSRPSRR